MLTILGAACSTLSAVLLTGHTRALLSGRYDQRLLEAVGLCLMTGIPLQNLKKRYYQLLLHEKT